MRDPSPSPDLCEYSSEKVGGGGQELREKHQSLKSRNWVKGSEKCSLRFARVCLLTVCAELPLCSGQYSWNEGYCLNPPAEHLIKE